jgi:RHS repeat-associated protein
VSNPFTGKERDSETGLDFFGARYYSGAQGRFISADIPFADQHTDNPQSWNLYQYAYNNPLINVDFDCRSVWTKVIKIAIKVIKTGNAAAAFADNIQDARTVVNSDASAGDRIIAGLSLASEVLPVSAGDVKDARRLLGLADDAVDLGKKAVKHTDDVKDAAKAGSKTFIATPEGVTLPPNQDFNLVPTNTGTKGDFLQIHGTHADSGVKPHTHVPEVQQRVREELYAPIAQQLRRI